MAFYNYKTVTNIVVKTLEKKWEQPLPVLKQGYQGHKSRIEKNGQEDFKVFFYNI